MARLTQRFFRRPPEVVAEALVGCELRTRDGIRLQVTEVEAYGGPEDSASHARFGRTARNETMFGPPGRAYVYLCYGIHQMFNVVAHVPGRAGAVLVRGCAVISGHELALSRRGRPIAERTDPSLVAGPGKVGQVLGVRAADSGIPLYRPGHVEVHAGRGAPGQRDGQGNGQGNGQGDRQRDGQRDGQREASGKASRVGPRVGIDFADPADRARPWRFAAEGQAVSHPRGLGPAARGR